MLHTCAHARARAHIHTHTHTYTHIHPHIHPHIHTYKQTQAYVRKLNVFLRSHKNEIQMIVEVGNARVSSF
jgi:hypothetical protein